MIKVFRDPVHNLIYFDKNKEKLIIDLINTKEMQRLRRIKQLGLSFFTYSGADHSRFSHALGAAYLAKRVIESLSSKTSETFSEYVEEIEDNRLALLAAALLHDIGHGPFSHALEMLTKKSHEMWTIEIIGDESTEVNKVLKDHGGDDFIEKIKDIIRRTEKPLLVKIISSQLDVDRFDYLLRDSLMAGVEYGKYDLEWILHSLRVKEVEDAGPEIVLDISKGKHAVEGYLLARYWMYKQVYHHKTTRGAEILVSKIFKRASDLIKGDNQIPINSVSDPIKGDSQIPINSVSVMKKLLKGDPLTVSEYLEIDDITFLYFIKEWANSEDEVLSDLCRRFINRRLFKAVDISDENLKDTFDLVEQLREEANNMGKDGKYYIEFDEPSNIVYKDEYLYSGSTAKKHDTEKEEKDAEKEVKQQIFVLLKDGKIREFSDPNVSPIINELRNKKEITKRLYFPEELRDKVEKIFSGRIKR